VHGQLVVQLPIEHNIPLTCESHGSLRLHHIHGGQPYCNLVPAADTARDQGQDLQRDLPDVR